MSPDNLDALINLAAWGHHQIGTFGPGLGLAAGVWVLVRVPRALRRAGKQVDAWLDRIRWNNSTAIKPAAEPGTGDVWIEAEHEEMRLQGQLLEAAPVIPTAHGTDRKALRTCKRIMRATNREEARR